MYVISFETEVGLKDINSSLKETLFELSSLYFQSQITS